jgi:hypothetical protein
MAEIRRRAQDSRSLWLLLSVVAVLATVIITSCGSGGGGSSSNGELCDQCGDDPDGPCREFVIVTSPTPPAPTPIAGDANLKCTEVQNDQCVVRLTCRRKTDSGQRRCFPLAPGGADVDDQFRCDGSRPGGTPRPPELTPTPAFTTSPEPQTCGNSVREGTEECDAPDFNGGTCASHNCGTGTLGCTTDCTLNFINCTGIQVDCQ